MEIKLNSVMKPLGILAAAAIVLAAIKGIAFIVGPLMLATLFVAILRPLYSAMRRKRFPNGLAVLITIIVFILIIAFIGWVFSLAISQTVAIFEQYSSDISGNFQKLDAAISQLPSYASGLSGLLKSVDPVKISGFVTGFVGVLADFLGKLVILFFLFVFFLTGGSLLMQRMRETFGEQHQLTVKTRTFLDNLAKYFILRTLVNAITGVGIALGCVFLGIPNAFLWGLLTFVLSYIPYIGMFIACVPPGLIAFAQGGTTELAIFVVICIIMNGLAEQVVSPLVTGKGLSVSPWLIFVSFIFWGWYLGSVGYVVAVPMTLLVLLFLNSFEETAGFAHLVSEIPEPE
jgi:AI-2 transport protein TqsA